MKAQKKLISLDDRNLFERGRTLGINVMETNTANDLHALKGEGKKTNIIYRHNEANGINCV